MAADPRRLYREIVEVEKQLRELLRSNPLNAHDANAMRSRLIDSARALAQSAPLFAAQRELEQVLWKPCFYKRIEDFRRRIRKYAAAPAHDRAVREHFARVSHEFQAFLNDASSFYESLRGAFTAWLLQQHRVIHIATPSTPAETHANTDKCRASLFRCLVFLGDVARYRELHSQKAKKNFLAAETFYHKALAVIPENGNPHNQLAVLATYVEAETVAVYRYCRSLLIAQPFATAEENLALLFERSRQRPLAPPTTAVVTTASTAKDKSAYLKSFLHRLTRMHGILFSLASASGAETSSTSSTPVPVYSKEMESLLMKDLKTLVATGVVGDALLLKLVVINLFCVVRARATAAVLDDALRLAVRTLTVVVDFLVGECSKLNATKATFGNGPSASVPLPNALRLLSVVSTLCDFLRLNPHFLDALDAMVSRGSEGELSMRSATAWFTSLANLLNHPKIQSVVQSVHSGGEVGKVSARQRQLKENIELRGFAPLSALVDAGSINKWRDDLVATTTPNASTTIAVSDQDAWTTRVWNVHAFGTFLCEDYEGNPLLYCYKGQFSTSPSVVSGISNGFTIAPRATASMGLFGVTPVSSSSSSSNGAAVAVVSTTTTSADDFDDEIIVYQPSPPLAPSQSQTRGEGSSARGFDSSSSVLGGGPLSTPFGSDPFSLGASASPFGHAAKPPPPQPQQQQQPPLFQQRLSLASPSSVFGSFTTAPKPNTHTTPDDGASLGYTSGTSGFQSFGPLGSGTSFATQSAFSGHGFLSAGWGQAAPQGGGVSPVTSLAKSFATPNATPPPLSSGSSFRGSVFGDMDDLAAVERASSLYQQRESSLSAFLGAPTLTTSKTLSAIASPSSLPLALPMTGMPPVPTTRSASLGGGARMAPPPGFATASPPGFGAPTAGDAARHRTPQQQHQPQPQQPPFFTRNPFANA